MIWKENKRIPIKIPEKSFVYNKLYYSKTEVNDKFEWVSQPIYYGVISFDSEWQIDVLKSVSKDSLDYYNYTDADGNEHSSKVSDFMIDKQGCIFIKSQNLWDFALGQKRKNKTKRFRYVRGGKQTPVCSRTVHS